MADNNIEGAALREINGRRKSDWVGLSSQLPPDLKAKLEEVSAQHEVPVTSIVIYACERLLQASAT